jgi:hypothetical protein
MESAPSDDVTMPSRIAHGIGNKSETIPPIQRDALHEIAVSLSETVVVGWALNRRSRKRSAFAW